MNEKAISLTSENQLAAALLATSNFAPMFQKISPPIQFNLFDKPQSLILSILYKYP